MQRPANLWTAWYLAHFGAMAKWQRFEVQGLERLLGDQPYMLVGYHGRPLAWDLLMLGTVIHKHKGYLPHGLIHTAFAHGIAGHMIRDLGFVVADSPELAAALARGEHMLVAPGGIQEGCRDHRHRYKVTWPDKFGYLRMALRYNLQIVPVAASGVDDMYVGLNDGGKLGDRIKMPLGLPFWFGLGPAGLWPFSVPFPAKVTQRIGEPIDLAARGVQADDKAALLSTHREIGATIQRTLDDLRAKT